MNIGKAFGFAGYFDAAVTLKEGEGEKQTGYKLAGYIAGDLIFSRGKPSAECQIILSLFEVKALFLT